MTPCEEKGYHVGDKFIVVDSIAFVIGSVVELEDDDESDFPLFKLISGECRWKNSADHQPGAYTHLDDVKKL